MAVVQVSARVDGAIRDKAEKVFEQYGLDISTAIRSMLSIAANSNRLPFVIGRPFVSLDGDSFANDTEYFKQLPGYWESIVKASEEPESDGKLYDPESFWNEG
ncbi:MAG TPA: type II toxin-antitoxin system RelB/DinJ family antitoxin [Kiritimatiellia bacterium]|nr:type II toxin-antitoxin system RelB/DinJ family antitoxin [Kiritimatiellia bacterium]HRT29645.1 type II toxin-antitoxin system RelB/DinJ family antitoxin [Kiritimatiellia bacterium]